MVTRCVGNSFRLAGAFALALVALAAALLMGVQPAQAAELAAGGVDGDAVQVGTQSDYEYVDADHNIYFYKKTAGTCTYNAATRTITLNGVKASEFTVYIENQNFTLVLNGASSFERAYSYSNITVKGPGSIALSEKLNVFKSRTLTVAGGTVNGPISCGSLNMQSGAINIVNPKYEGIYVSDGNLVMTGGSISVTGAGSYAIDVYKNGDGKNIGKAIFKGGSLIAKTATPKTGYAVYAGSMTNTLACLKGIAGRVPNGAQFKVGKNLYKIMTDNYSAELVKYNGGKKAKVNTVTFGGHTYDVGGIGKGAFNTKAGKKVTSITISSSLSKIGAKAFYGTKSLKTLTMSRPYWIKSTGFKNTLKLKVRPECSVAKKAFTKCGKGGGKGLTVKLYSTGVWSKEAAKYKKFLKSKGMSGAAKLKTY